MSWPEQCLTSTMCFQIWSVMLTYLGRQNTSLAGVIYLSVSSFELKQSSHKQSVKRILDISCKMFTNYFFEKNLARLEIFPG